MSLDLKFESKDHRACWYKCDVVLNEVKNDIKDEALKLRKDGLPIEKVWRTAYDLVSDNGWEDLGKRLKKLFEDDTDPLNITRRKVASLFYDAKTVDFKVRFRKEVEAVLKGEEIPEKKEAPVTEDISSDYDEEDIYSESDEEEIEEDSETEINTDLGEKKLSEKEGISSDSDKEAAKESFTESDPNLSE